MDITKFAEMAKQRGYVEWSQAHALKELAETWIEYQELQEEIHASQYPVAAPATEAKVAELRMKIKQLEADLNA